MFEFVKKLMIGKEMNFEEGKVLLLKEPICLMPIETVVDIIRSTKNQQNNVLYQAAKVSGKYWFDKITERFYKEKMPPEKILEWGNNIIALAGYGISIVHKFDINEKYIVFYLKNSTICELYGKSKKPLDHIYRGFIAGAGSIMLNGDSEAVELNCKSMGSPYCEFIVKHKDKFDKKDPIVKEQLG